MGELDLSTPSKIPVGIKNEGTGGIGGNAIKVKNLLGARRQALLAARGSGEPGDPGSDVPAGSVPEIEIGPVRQPDDDAHDVNEFVDTANNAERTLGDELRAPSGKVLPAQPAE